ncbi:MAG: hypothetical protein IPP83_10750 [Flavobacteriales bacterium]|nr:hypothetical protein [Flavobacteriales bacterium]
MATNYEAFYTNLGYLLYSVAANDGQVRPEERAALGKLIKEQWLPLESSRDAMGTDKGHYIDIGFDFANDEGMETDEAFRRFGEHLRAQTAMYDVGMRRMIMQTAVAIADSVAGRNKSELTRLTQLRMLFGEVPVPDQAG